MGFVRSPIRTAIPNAVQSPFGDYDPLVNLLWIAGGCENVSYWTPTTCSCALTASNKKQGSNGFLITVASGANGYIGRALPLDVNKYYLMLADLKNGTATNVQLKFRLYGTGTGEVVSTHTGASFITKYIKVSPAQLVGLTPFAEPRITVNGSEGQTAYVDAVRVYEISKKVFDLIDIDPEYTGPALAQKFPYCDSLGFYDHV